MQVMVMILYGTLLVLVSMTAMSMIVEVAQTQHYGRCLKELLSSKDQEGDGKTNHKDWENKEKEDPLSELAQKPPWFYVRNELSDELSVADVMGMKSSKALTMSFMESYCGDFKSSYQAQFE
ncbi:MAG: hypothetical protein OXC44_04140 [Proteobacteria bacterium]|nr:hypothetical protein [Pseudomonadota bacterium]